MDKLRLRFEKTGRAVYISHLDLMHTLQRAFSRAGLELKYSEGFNPHPQISIALPLSVGMSSVCEILDFKLMTEADPAQLPVHLNAVMPEGIRVVECYEPVHKVSQLKYLEITGTFEYDARPVSEMKNTLETFFARESIVIAKKTKRGEGPSDIRPAIRSIAFAEGKDAVLLRAVISAQEPTLNPTLLADALRQLFPSAEPDFAKFERIENYLENMEFFR